jgi:hypothetical protein
MFLNLHPSGQQGILKSYYIIFQDDWDVSEPSTFRATKFLGFEKYIYIILQDDWLTNVASEPSSFRPKKYLYTQFVVVS